ncbi:Nuclear transcription factor Y subunit C-2 [Datura stramonium]|uniref:Nuclear transcription factor Y subunit C-2 n=1 Tax=Datura stramonium TaxID=4076 RepID=A0ABS8RU33_DATST|nr:Nuclear transcription factor Y subunit C-2 [Datura stramonium]
MEATTPHSAGYPAQPPYDHLMEQQENKLQIFWTFHHQKIEQVNDFKNYQIPRACIKKIMKADRDVRMISQKQLFYLSRQGAGLGLDLVGSTSSSVSYYYPPMGQPSPPAAIEDNYYASGGNSGQGQDNFDCQR